MRRAETHPGRGALVLVLSVLLLVAGVVGLSASAPEPVGPSSGNHTTDLDLAVGATTAPPQRAVHGLRLDGPATAWAPVGTEPVTGEVAYDALSASAVPSTDADRTTLRGRAPPV